MKRLWTVLRFELLLYWRGWPGWGIALIAALLGWIIAPIVNLEGPFLWEILCLCFGFLTLMLALTTGSQIQHDREHRLDGIIMSTAVATGSFVLGKYLAGLLTVLFYAAITLLALVITSGGTIGAGYFSPPLGSAVIMQVWLMLVPVSLLFVSALMQFGISLVRGKRVLIFVIVLLIWILPLTIGGKYPDVLNLSTPSFLILSGEQGTQAGFPRIESVKEFYLPKLSENGTLHFTREDGRELVHLYQTVFISEHMNSFFLLNRAFFLGLTILLLIITVYCVNRQRQGQW